MTDLIDKMITLANESFNFKNNTYEYGKEPTIIIQVTEDIYNDETNPFYVSLTKRCEELSNITELNLKGNNVKDRRFTSFYIPGIIKIKIEKHEN